MGEAATLHTGYIVSVGMGAAEELAVDMGTDTDLGASGLVGVAVGLGTGGLGVDVGSIELTEVCVAVAADGLMVGGPGGDVGVAVGVGGFGVKVAVGSCVEVGVGVGPAATLRLSSVISPLLNG